MTGYFVTILKCIMRWFLHDDVSCIADVAADVSNKSKQSVMTKKTRLCMTKSDRHRTKNAVNGAVKMLGRREIMTKVVFHPWPKAIVTDWNHFNDDASIVTEWRHICDENYHFVTYDQMWRDHSDEIQIITNSSQMNISDDYGVFSDVRWTSSMTTSLLVLGQPF
jgi:hypothetical protein